VFSLDQGTASGNERLDHQGGQELQESRRSRQATGAQSICRPAPTWFVSASLSAACCNCALVSRLGPCLVVKGPATVKSSAADHRVALPSLRLHAPGHPALIRRFGLAPIAAAEQLLRLGKPCPRWRRSTQVGANGVASAGRGMTALAPCQVAVERASARQGTAESASRKVLPSRRAPRRFGATREAPAVLWKLQISTAEPGGHPGGRRMRLARCNGRAQVGLPQVGLDQFGIGQGQLAHCLASSKTESGPQPIGRRATVQPRQRRPAGRWRQPGAQARRITARETAAIEAVLTGC